MFCLSVYFQRRVAQKLVGHCVQVSSVHYADVTFGNVDVQSCITCNESSLDHVCGMLRV